MGVPSTAAMSMPLWNVPHRGPKPEVMTPCNGQLNLPFTGGGLAVVGGAPVVVVAALVVVVWPGGGGFVGGGAVVVVVAGAAVVVVAAVCCEMSAVRLASCWAS